MIARTLSLFPVLLGASVLVFLLAHLAPGDITTAMLGELATEQARAELRDALGLNEPLAAQYVSWLGRVLRGDFGMSFASSQSVASIIIPRFGNTLILSLAAMMLATTSALLVGVYAGSKPGSLFDRIATSSMLVLGSTPSFWFAMILVLIFSLSLQWLPSVGMTGPGGSDGVLSVLEHLLLPAIAAAVTPAAIMARSIRAAIQEALSQPYILVARARGIPQETIVWSHALRNAMPPILTIFGLQLGKLLGGAVFAEVVFAWPGIGLQLYEAILARDIPMIQAAILIAAVVFSITNLLVDVVNSRIDPKARAL